MKELIGIAVLIAGLFGGTLAAEKILQEVRVAALTKAAQGLPPMTSFARGLTQKKQTRTDNLHHRQVEKEESYKPKPGEFD